MTVDLYSEFKKLPSSLPLRISRSADSANLAELSARLDTLFSEIPLSTGAFQPPVPFNLNFTDFKGLGRGEAYERFLTREFDILSLGEMFARRVTAGHNKNIVFTLFGDIGTGKSMTLLGLATSCAQWIARLKGWGPPEKYFNFEHVAIIDPDALQDTLNNLEPYGIYILDDAGPGFDARAFMSATNRSLGHILQTCRTFHNIILISAPYAAMIDITAHRIAQYYAEVAEAFHENGLTMVKVFHVARSYRDKKTYYVYPTKGKGIVIRRYAAELPPEELKREYDIVRDRKASEIQRMRDGDGDEDDNGGGRRGKRGSIVIPTPPAPLGPRQLRIAYALEHCKSEMTKLATAGRSKGAISAELTNIVKKKNPEGSKQFNDYTAEDITKLFVRMELKYTGGIGGGTQTKKAPTRTGPEGTHRKKAPTNADGDTSHRPPKRIVPRRDDKKPQEVGKSPSEVTVEEPAGTEEALRTVPPDPQ